ncbi:hypothetical protein [Spirobacillus cienkowskii]|uniref:hypothetical protein n=1 Tax=Spirobacillus cienkowskii TaxID=495820 RepID=UPI0030D3902C
MKKAHTAFSRSIFLSVFTLVGCGFKGNTNMQTEAHQSSLKADAVSSLFGTPLHSDPKINVYSLKNALIKAPDHVSPTGNNTENYDKIKSAALKYVNENIAKSDATEIVSITKFADVLKDSGFDDSYYDASKVNEENFIAIPFLEQNSENVTDLSEYKTRTGINNESKFKVYGTKNGKLDKSTFAEGTVYLFTYKLNNSDVKHSAIITVPDSLSNENQLPLILYAHGGDSGVSFRNIAQIMQSNLAQGIVAAPTFPGEAICAITTLGGTQQNLLRRSCGDASDNVENPVLVIEGVRSPLHEDVNSLIGVHNAITKLALNTVPNKPTIKFSDNTIDQNFKNQLSFLRFNAKYSAISFLNSPQTLGVAASRGGATLLATIGRIGIYYENIFKELLTSKEQSLNFNFIEKIPKLPLLSGAALYYSPSTLLMGDFALPFHYILRGHLFDSSDYNRFPMVPDLNKNPYIVNYRNAPADNHEQELNNLAGWLAASDTTFLGPYLSVAMQNWTYTIDSLSNKLNANIEEQFANSDNKNLVETLQKSGAMRSGTPSIQGIIAQLPKLKDTNEAHHAQAQKVIKDIFTKSIGERQSAPGSIILLHATHDQVVPYTQSLITKSILDKVFDLVHNKNSSESQKKLTSFRIPPLGAQLFAFQPEDKFYTVVMNTKTLDNSICTKENNTFNQNKNACFGGTRHSLAHGDAAFATSALINQSASNQEGVLKNILKNGIPTASNIQDILEKLDGGYRQVEKKLQKEINNLKSEIENPTTNIATRKANETNISKAQKEYNYLTVTKLNTTCTTESPSGVCYLKNGPQFHRPLYLDGKQNDFLIDKKWDTTAASAQSPLTPSDVLGAWFASAAQEVLTQ